MLENLLAETERLNGKQKKEKQKAVVEYALKSMYFHCTANLKIREQDQEHLLRSIANYIICDNTAKQIYEILFKQKNVPEFHNFCEWMRKEVEKRFYAPYFHSFTRTQGNVTYNFLLGMFWNPQTKMWVNSQNGEISWSLFSESA